MSAIFAYVCVKRRTPPSGSDELFLPRAFVYAYERASEASRDFDAGSGFGSRAPVGLEGRGRWYGVFAPALASAGGVCFTADTPSADGRRQASVKIPPQWRDPDGDAVSVGILSGDPLRATSSK